MFLLQVISVAFAIFMLYVVRIHRKKQHIESFEYGAWCALWAVFIFLAIFPQTVQGVVQSLHIARVFDLLVIVALMIIVFLTYHNRIQHQALQKKIEQMIRQRAIDEHTTPNH